MSDQQPLERLRLDVWLDIACVFRTRSEAQKACKGGKVAVNGERAKPHRDVKVGDEITVTRPLGRRQRLVVRGLADRHMRKAEARALYEDLTPPPTLEEVEMRRLARETGFAMRLQRKAAAPSKRDRRTLRQLKERG